MLCRRKVEVALGEPATPDHQLDVPTLVLYPLGHCAFFVYILFFSLPQDTRDGTLYFYIAGTACDLICILFTLKDIRNRANEEVALAANGQPPREQNHVE